MVSEDHLKFCQWLKQKLCLFFQVICSFAVFPRLYQLSANNTVRIHYPMKKNHAWSLTPVKSSHPCYGNASELRNASHASTLVTEAENNFHFGYRDCNQSVTIRSTHSSQFLQEGLLDHTIIWSCPLFGTGHLRVIVRVSSHREGIIMCHKTIIML